VSSSASTKGETACCRDAVMDTRQNQVNRKAIKRDLTGTESIGGLSFLFDHINDAQKQCNKYHASYYGTDDFAE